MFYLVIRTENLTKYYGHRIGVKNFTLEVEPGEVFGVLGTKGAGKTTLVRMLLDLVHPTSGRALVLGRDVQRFSKEVRRQIGFVPASFSFPGYQTGESSLRFLAGLRGNVSWSYVRELSERMNVDLSQKCSKYSAADRQKIGLIQAFMHRPEVILLDEPTTSLDTRDQQALFNLVAEVRRDGRSVFYATQSLHEVDRVSDRVGIVHEGNLMAVERTVRLRGRALRKVEVRFASPVSPDLFAGLSNIENLRMEDNLLSCTVRGDPDALIKLASQYRVTDFLCQPPALDEVFRTYYGMNGYAA